jgi:hypothetical protein
MGDRQNAVHIAHHAETGLDQWARHH